MARPLRIEYEGAWYHVMNRGATHKKIFYTDADRKLFLKLLGHIHHKYKIQIHAYCLMSNHYHLLVHTPLGNLNKCMRYLNGVYTQLFNKNNKIDGPLFRGRYKAIIVDADAYLLHLNKYIHINPVAAKICINPGDYKWSSYTYYLENKKKPEWLYCDATLKRFGETDQRAKYKLFLQDEMNHEIISFYQKTKKLPILGSKAFSKMLKEKIKNKKIDKEIPEQKMLNKLFVPTIKQVVDIVAGYYKVGVDEVKISHKGKMNIMRSIAIYLAVDCCQVSLGQIGDEFSGISRNGVSNSYKRISNKLKFDPQLRSEVDYFIKSYMKMGNGAT